MSSPRQPDLFDISQPRSAATRADICVQGLAYQSDFISFQEERTLVDAIDRAPWRSDLRRRVQHYGWRYDYKARRIDRTMYLGQLPTWLDDLSTRLVTAGWFDRAPDQAIVNEYQAGQGIAPHIDCIPCFGPVVVSISLLSSVLMDFYNPASSAVFSQLLEPRSAIVLSGASRTAWKHGIAPRLNDTHDGLIERRRRRISITFRTIIAST
ncbi:MAG: alpha-ketoglutarate-dependent dioxygenase AlkB [Rhodospirillales bacterium]|nr:alpha-ketoglutarate-dependent dioxygenase AlkB [Rhodospirillales bacterium]